MNLYLKYRPTNFDTFIGNEEVVSKLQSVLNRKSPPHSFLFTGPSGCGKTTLARIAKDQLGCHKKNYTEMDTAGFRGIDTIRELRKAMSKKGLEGGIRVWLLDECHQLSKDAQAALLKGLEDTPKHAYLLLATTNPEKLLPTIRNRCSHFHVDSLDFDSIKELISNICREEEKRVPKSVTDQIAQDSLGSPRAALVALDSIIDMNKKDMKEAAKQLKFLENEAVELFRLLMKGTSWKKLTPIIKNIKKENCETVRRKALFYFEAVLLNGNEQAADIMDELIEHTYDTDWPGLTLKFYNISK